MKRLKTLSNLKYSDSYDKLEGNVDKDLEVVVTRVGEEREMVDVPVIVAYLMMQNLLVASPILTVGRIEDATRFLVTALAKLMGIEIIQQWQIAWVDRILFANLS